MARAQKIKKHLLVELAGPGGLCKVVASEVNTLLRKPGWRLATAGDEKKKEKKKRNMAQSWKRSGDIGVIVPSRKHIRNFNDKEIKQVIKDLNLDLDPAWFKQIDFCRRTLNQIIQRPHMIKEAKHSSITRLNIGAGIWERTGWDTLDNPVSHYLKKGLPANPTITQDLTHLQPLPLADEQLDLVYTSHLLEHLSNNEVNYLLREVWRCLKPDGTFRVVIPNIDYEIGRYNRKEITGKQFVYRFATYTSQAIPEVEVDKALKRLKANKSATLNGLTRHIPNASHIENPGWRRNWFDPVKIIKLLEEAGFKTAYQSERGKSFSSEMRNKEFDSSFPFLSMYIEATG